MFAGIAGSLRFAVLLCLVAEPAFAMSKLSVDSDQQVNPNASLNLQLSMSFDDATVGGGITLAFDETVLHLSSVSFDGALGDDPGFQCPEGPGTQIPCPPDPNFLSFGGLNALVGDHLVATLFFQAIGVPGDSSVVTASIASPFSDLAGSPLDVEFKGSLVRIVPEPATLSLLFGGLVVLGRQRRSLSRSDARG